MQVQPREQRIVVKHFLKMRHQPMCINGVSMKPAAKLIINAAAGHLSTGVLYDFQGFRAAGPVVTVEQIFQSHGRRKLWRAAKATVGLIVVCNNSSVSGVKQIESENL